jgi:outer membrane protein
MKRSVVLVVVVCLVAFLTSAAPQFARIALVDVQRIYNSYYKEIPAVKAYDSLKSTVEAEINRQNGELTDIRQQKANAEKAGNADKARQLDAEINTRIAALKDYYAKNSAQLEQLRKAMPDSKDAMNNVYSQIAKNAQEGGLTLVLDYKNTDSIVWFSSTVDYSDRIISDLKRGK